MEIIGFELFSEFNSFYPKLILVCIILFILITSISIKFNFSENAYLVTILITLIIILSVSMYHTYNRTIKNPNYFSLTIYYTNENNQIIKDNEKQIVKNIINNIINDKIPNNRKNLQVYKQTFGISFNEYNLLKEYEDKYNFWSEFKKIEIFE
jgi:hypothetical protein